MDLNGSTLVTKSEILRLRQEKKKNQQKIHSCKDKGIIPLNNGAFGLFEHNLNSEY